MTRKTVTLISIAILVVGLIVGGVIGCTPSPEPLSPEGKEEPKEVEVGKGEYGLAVGQRYHDIHTTEQGLACATCHISEPGTTQTVFGAQDVSSTAPGPVDKKACLGCHSDDGPGKDLYSSDSP